MHEVGVEFTFSNKVKLREKVIFDSALSSVFENVPK
jgi:hypothetical protein